MLGDDDAAAGRASSLPLRIILGTLPQHEEINVNL